MGKLSGMTTRDLLRADWEAIGHQLLDAAATHLAAAARARAAAPLEAIRAEVLHAAAARITLVSPDLLHREQGAPSRPPQGLLAPRAEDLAAARACMIRILHGEDA